MEVNTTEYRRPKKREKSGGVVVLSVCYGGSGAKRKKSVAKARKQIFLWWGLFKRRGSPVEGDRTFIRW